MVLFYGFLPERGLVMDTFFEQIVAKRKSFGEIFLQTGIWVFGIFIGIWLLLFSFLNYHAFFMAVALLVMLLWVGMYYLSRSMNIEFEYSVTNGSFDLDKITAKSKRRRLAAFECKNVERFGRYDPAAHQNVKYDKKIIAASGKPSDEQYFLTVRLPEGGHTLMVITPNDRVLGAIKQFLPRQVAQDANRA